MIKLKFKRFRLKIDDVVIYIVGINKILSYFKD